MRHAFPIFGAGLLCGLLWLTIADNGRAQAPEPAPLCGQRGRVIFDKDSTLSDAAGRKLARFSGGESAVTLLAPPVEGSELSKIETGSGRGSFRIRGFIKASELRIFTSSALPVVSGHVWLAPGTRVVVAGSSAGKVRIDKPLGPPFDQHLSTTADCSALTFNQLPAPVESIPANARVFLLNEPQLELFASVPPTGSPILTLRRAAAVNSVRFFSREQRGGFVHVQYQGEVTIDAWAKASELTPRPRGETSDVPAASFTLSSAPQLQLSQLPRVVRTTRELPLRLAAKEADAPIGVIEPDTELYVMDSIGSWAKVLPKSLHILPVGEQAFWVKAADLDPGP